MKKLDSGIKIRILRMIKTTDRVVAFAQFIATEEGISGWVCFLPRDSSSIGWRTVPINAQPFAIDRVNSLLEIIHRVHLNLLAAKLSDVKKSIYKNIFSQYYNLISAPDNLCDLCEKKDVNINRIWYSANMRKR